uniref:Uncharacterized protein n=1 Tax=Rousettus aegyptiacus TaxID=9407 RepID=A0A7J8HS45_ROUAE|nr:hypothetical protein HJG63_010895 [Rousettus aegyptiacus]
MPPVNSMEKEAKIMLQAVSFPCSFGELLLLETMCVGGAGSQCFASSGYGNMASHGTPSLLPTWGGARDQAQPSSSSTISHDLLGEREAPSAPLGIKPWRPGPRPGILLEGENKSSALRLDDVRESQATMTEERWRDSDHIPP